MADGRTHWLVRLSLRLGRTPTELAEVLTAADLSLYQAVTEIDGPWWGESETAHLRQLTAVTAAAGGVPIPSDEFRITWTVGGDSGPGEGVYLLDPADGLKMWAQSYGLTVTEEPAGVTANG